MLELTHDESLQPRHIVVGVEEHAVRDFPVPSGSARLLVVPLHRLGERRVDHKPHVRLVDAHSKGNGRADHLRGEQKAISPGAQ